MKRYASFAALMVPFVANAGEFGVGGSVRSDGGTLFAPIEVNESVRVEPYVSYNRDTSTINGFSQTTSSLLGGVGLFGKTDLQHNFRGYYGLRAAYLHSSFSGSSTVPQNDRSGFYVEPVLGAEYLLTGQVAIGLEEAWFYRKETDDTGHGTEARLLLRFYFSPQPGVEGDKKPEINLSCPAPSCPTPVCPASPVCPAVPPPPPSSPRSLQEPLTQPGANTTQPDPGKHQ